MNPDGSYLIVRITSDYMRNNEPTFAALLILVDLHSFSIALRRSTTDPLIANSNVQFYGNDLLVASGIVKVKNGAVAATTYAAGVLRLPDLQPTASCQYEKELRFESGGWNWIASQHSNDDCAAVLQAAAASSVEDLPGGSHWLERNVKPQNVDYCTMTEVSRDGKFALYDCGKGHLDGSFETGRASRVISIDDRKTVLSIRLPVTQPIAALLAVNGVQNYLLLLRDGIRLETYPLN